MSNLIDKAKQILSFAIASLSFTASFIGYTCLIFGSNTIRVIALLILIYQYTLATRWEKLITWSISLRGDKYFKKFEVIFEEPILVNLIYNLINSNYRYHIFNFFNFKISRHKNNKRFC